MIHSHWLSTWLTFSCWPNHYAFSLRLKGPRRCWHLHRAINCFFFLIFLYNWWNDKVWECWSLVENIFMIMWHPTTQWVQTLSTKSECVCMVYPKGNSKDLWQYSANLVIYWIGFLNIFQMALDRTHNIANSLNAYNRNL